STLVILQHRLRDQKTSPRPSIDVVKSYGELTAVNCYPGLLNQVFMNLISNAIDAIDDCYVEDGTEENLPKVAVSSPQIEILTDQLDENWVRIQVRDSGQGLPEEFAERLFDPFFTTKSVGQGTGLGLSIAHKIVVERHGGRISGRSLPSHGAEFTVDLPIGVMDGQAASSDTALGDMTPVDQLGDRPMEMTAGA
ncbi:MAG: HAMP domain-containing sensor histidine kinase, partial [Cyanobacteria bacterium P01_D01_bin.73]